MGVVEPAADGVAVDDVDRYFCKALTVLTGVTDSWEIIFETSSACFLSLAIS